nr:insulinase family protein [Gemmatimonadota bacterium]
MSASTPQGREFPPPAGQLRPFHFPPVHREGLSNGMELLVAESHHLPVISFGLLLRAGGIHEDAARAGVAVLAGDLLDTGAAGRSGMELATAMEDIGALHDVTTSWDSTYLGLTTLRSQFEPGVAILADLALRPDFPEEEVARLREERLAAIAQRRASPGGLAGEVVMRSIFSPDSPFSRPLAGDPETVRGLMRADVSAFHAARYTPAGAAAVVAGDMAPGEAVELAERYFGGWSGAPAHFISPAVVARHPKSRLLLVDRPGSVQAEIRAGHIGIARGSDDYFSTLVMNQILGGAFASRLNLNLREKHGFTYGASSTFIPHRDPGPFLISTAVQSDAAAPAVREILAEVEAIRAGGATPAELD